MGPKAQKVSLEGLERLSTEGLGVEIRKFRGPEVQIALETKRAEERCRAQP